MSNTPDPSPRGANDCPTLYFWPDAPPEHIDAIEEFRAEYELLHGPTDRTRRYITQAPLAQGDALFLTDALGYFDQCPGFVRAYFMHLMRLAAQDGRLDQFTDRYLALYMREHRRGSAGIG